MWSPAAALCPLGGQGSVQIHKLVGRAGQVPGSFEKVKTDITPYNRETGTTPDCSSASLWGGASEKLQAGKSTGMAPVPPEKPLPEQGGSSGAQRAQASRRLCPLAGVLQWGPPAACGCLTARAQAGHPTSLSRTLPPWTSVRPLSTIAGLSLHREVTAAQLVVATVCGSVDKRSPLPNNSREDSAPRCVARVGRPRRELLGPRVAPRNRGWDRSCIAFT